MENAVERKRIELQKLLAPAALVILYVFFSLFGRNFFGYEGLKQIFQSSYYIGFMAFGVTFVIITGGIDLSIGTAMMCSALIGGVAFTVWGWPVWLALLLVPVVGLCFGLLNGVMIAKAKLPPFIATLGVMLISQGFGSILSNVRTMHDSPAYVGDWFRSVFYLYHNIPIGAIWLLGAFAVAFLLLSRTRLGRYTFAIGSNEEAARLSGVKVDAWKIGIYAICGLFSGLAGLFFGGAYTTITPGTGNGEELNAIAAVVIGGTSMSGGSGTMAGTLIGVLIMSTLKKGLASVGLQAHWQTFFTGFVVIGAVLLDQMRNRVATTPRGSRRSVRPAVRRLCLALQMSGAALVMLALGGLAQQSTRNITAFVRFCMEYSGVLLAGGLALLAVGIVLARRARGAAAVPADSPGQGT